MSHGRRNRALLDTRRSPQWIRFRKFLLDLRGWRCEACHHAHARLELHHTTPVEDDITVLYDQSRIRILCAPCHINLHQRERLSSDEWEWKKFAGGGYDVVV